MSLIFKMTGNDAILRTTVFPPIEVKSKCRIGMQYFLTENYFYNITEDNNSIFLFIKKPKFMVFDKFQMRVPPGLYEFAIFKEAVKQQMFNTITGPFTKINKNEENVEEFMKYQDLLEETVKEMIFEFDLSNFKLRIDMGVNMKFEFVHLISPANLLGISDELLPLTFSTTIDTTFTHLLKTVNMATLKSLNISCNLTGNSYINGERSHLLYSVPVTVSPGFKIYEAPKDVLYLEVTEPLIDLIEITITDQDGKIIDFQGHDVLVILGMRFD